jgi:DnaJ family protein C protein 25
MLTMPNEMQHMPRSHNQGNDDQRNKRQSCSCRRSTSTSPLGRSLVLLLVLSLIAATFAPYKSSILVSAQDSDESATMPDESAAATEGSNTGQSETGTGEETKKPPKVEEKDTFNAKDHMDWGTYYDPKNIFCGQYDCYKILGFDYENYGKEKPSTKVITKRYRALSREWHPDKSKHKDAKERFTVSF